MGPSLLSLLPALLLVVLSDGLRRGRRAAWAAAVAMHVFLGGLGGFLLWQATVNRSPEVLVTVAMRHVRFLLALAIPLLVPLVVLLVLLGTRRLFDVSAPRRTYATLAGQAGGLVALVCSMWRAGSPWAPASTADPALSPCCTTCRNASYRRVTSARPSPPSCR